VRSKHLIEEGTELSSGEEMQPPFMKILQASSKLSMSDALKVGMFGGGSVESRVSVTHCGRTFPVRPLKPRADDSGLV
jgi:hypothetical protein